MLAPPKEGGQGHPELRPWKRGWVAQGPSPAPEAMGWGGGSRQRGSAGVGIDIATCGAAMGEPAVLHTNSVSNQPE